MRIRKGILAALLSVVLILVCLVPAFAVYSGKSVTCKATVVQRIADGTSPQKKSYAYQVTPAVEGNPMPAEAENGMVAFALDNTNSKEVSRAFTFQFTEPGDYIYNMQVFGETPKGDTYSPDTKFFKFGFHVTEENGELTALAEICVGTGRIDKTDVYLDPVITGPKTTTPTTKVYTPTASRTNYSSGNSSLFAKYVNTEDGSRIVFWSSILLIATLMLIFLFFFKRKRDKDEEEA